MFKINCFSRIFSISVVAELRTGATPLEEFCMVGYGRGLITMCSALMQALIFQCPGLMAPCTVIFFLGGGKLWKFTNLLGGEVRETHELNNLCFVSVEYAVIVE